MFEELKAINEGPAEGPVYQVQQHLTGGGRRKRFAFDSDAKTYTARDANVMGEFLEMLNIMGMTRKGSTYRMAGYPEFSVTVSASAMTVKLKGTYE